MNHSDYIGMTIRICDLFYHGFKTWFIDTLQRLSLCELCLFEQLTVTESCTHTVQTPASLFVVYVIINLN